MKAIHKFELRVDITGTSCESLIIDHAAKVIHVGEQDGNIFIWAEVDTDSAVIEYPLQVFGTGHEMPVDMGVERQHLGSVVMKNGLVFHVYHRIN